MLLYVGFTDGEVSLLRKAAERLEVADRCRYVPAIGDLDEQGNLIDPNAISKIYPSVIFLNLDGEDGHWKQSLIDLKQHSGLCGLPVVGLGRVAQEDVAELYELKINSYIRKPDSFETMLHVADVALRFWLTVAELPGKYLANA